jgi:hypothetical protein
MSLNNEIEIWQPIVGYEWRYEVSNLGRVKSLFNGVILVSCLDPEYSIVSLKKEIGGYKTLKVHRLVMTAFMGKSHYHINHKDLNRQNNRLDNLEYCTLRQNCIHYNKEHPKTSKFIGVSWDKSRNKWRSTIKIKNGWRQLGRFNSEINAYSARLKGEIKFYFNGELSNDFVCPHQSRVKC